MERCHGEGEELHDTFGIVCKEAHATPPWREQPTHKWQAVEKGGKGKEKGKSKKGKGKGGSPHCATHTPEGDLICFRYNTPGERCKMAKCKYRHVCGICFSEKHPLYECTAKNRKEAAAPDTDGTK